MSLYKEKIVVNYYTVKMGIRSTVTAYISCLKIEYTEKKKIRREEI